jgi:plastocyanin
MRKKPDDVALSGGAQPFHSGNVKPEQEFTHTFDVPGGDTSFCVPHEPSGMVAPNTVQPKR